jgi:hypothetical protein
MSFMDMWEKVKKGAGVLRDLDNLAKELSPQDPREQDNDPDSTEEPKELTEETKP